MIKSTRLKDQVEIKTEIARVTGEQNVRRKTLIFKKNLSRIQEYGLDIGKNTINRINKRD